MGEYLPPSPPTGNDKAWSMLCHLSGFLGVPFLLPIIVYFAMRRDSALVACNAREALNFHLSTLIYSILCIPLCWVLIGIPLLFAIALATLVLSILAALAVSRDRSYAYPLTIPFFR
jgi:uncharacterized Tic20 family protein